MEDEPVRPHRLGAPLIERLAVLALVVLLAPVGYGPLSGLWSTSGGAHGSVGNARSMVAFDQSPPGSTPSIGVPSANRSFLDVGQSVEFMTIVAKGTHLGAYVWSESSPELGCVLAGTSVIDCSPLAPGNYTVSVYVITSAGVRSALATSSPVAVYAALSLAGLTANPTSIDLGQSVTFAAAQVGGSSDANVTWTNLPPGCSGGTRIVNCWPTKSIYEPWVSVRVTDSAGESASAILGSFWVFSDPIITNLSVTPEIVPVGTNVTFNASAVGGSGSLTYAWTGLPPGCSGTTSRISCAPSEPGIYAVHLNVTDYDNWTVSAAVTARVGIWAYPATFLASGVPSYDTWYVNITGGPSESAPGYEHNITIYLENGTYNFSVTTNDHSVRVSYVSAQNVTVNGAPAQAVVIEAREPRYLFIVNATGLPTGIEFGLELDTDLGTFYETCGAQWCLPIQSLPNGTWSYRVWDSSGLTVSPVSGVLVVEGASPILSLAFSVTPGYFLVSLDRESLVGLFSCNAWLLFPNGGFSSTGGSYANLTLLLPNGTYGYLLQCFGPWTPSPAIGTVVVNGSNATVNYGFIPGYEEVFYENQLPSGAEWFVNLTGGLSGQSTLAYLAVAVPNGSYTYTVGTSDPRMFGYPGNLTVNADWQEVGVSFGDRSFTVTFEEYGIPGKLLASEGWIVALGGTTEVAHTNTIIYTAPWANLSLLISGPSGWVASIAPGTISITHATWENVTFSKGRTFTLTFAEHGLLTGQSWCVAVHEEAWCTTRSALKYPGLPADTYAYFVVAPTATPYDVVTAKIGPHVVPLPGNLTLSRNQEVTLTFQSRWNVTFTESGLSSGNWSISIKGKTLSAPAGDPIVFVLPNGTYPYKVLTEIGYLSQGTPAKVVVEDRGAAVSVRFEPLASSLSAGIEPRGLTLGPERPRTERELAPTPGR